MAFYELMLRPLEDIRADTRVALAEGRSPMSVGMLRIVEVDEAVPTMRRFARTLFGDLP